MVAPIQLTSIQGDLCRCNCALSMLTMHGAYITACKRCLAHAHFNSTDVVDMFLLVRVGVLWKEQCTQA